MINKSAIKVKVLPKSKTPYTIEIDKRDKSISFKSGPKKDYTTPLFGSLEEEKDQAIYPSMIVDYHWGGKTRLESNSDPRYLLMKGGEWPLGVNGWVILGFENGFEAGADRCIKCSEQHTGEWIDIWVAGEDINFINPIEYVYLPINAHRTEGDIDQSIYPYSDSGLGFTQPYVQAKKGLVNFRPHWMSDKWYYLGRVKGKGGDKVLLENGPNLGYIPNKKYFFVLILDSGKIQTKPSKTPTSMEGADVSRVGIFPFKREPKSYYHYLLIDDSGSINTDTEQTQIKKALKKILESKLRFKGKNFFSLRLIREPKSSETPSIKTTRVRFGADYWLEAQSKDLDDLTNQFTSQLTFKGGKTPLIDALKDLLTDFSELDSIPETKEIHISILSDGFPDPEGNRPIDPLGVSNALKSTIKKEITEPNGIGHTLNQIKTKVDNFHLEFVSTLSIVSKTYNKDNWLEATYKSLVDTDGHPLISFVHAKDLTETGLTSLNHKEIPHTDCINNLVKKDDEWIVKANYRIGLQEFKRIAYDPTRLEDGKTLPVSLPVIDSGGKEILKEYLNTYNHKRPPYS